MKLKQLKNSKDLYSQLCAFIPEEKRLTPEKLATLEDKDFIGAKKLFPVVDIEHINAVRQLLSQVDDCGEKTQLLQLLDEKEKELIQSQEPPVQQAQSDDNNLANTQDDMSKPQELPVYKFIYQDDKWLPENNDETTNAQILQLLIDSMDESHKIEFVRSIIQTISDKSILLNELAGDQIADLQAQVDNLTHERTVQNTLLKTKDALIDEMSNDLKQFIVQDIIRYRRFEDPTLSIDTIVESLSKQSLFELKVTRDNLIKLFGDVKQNIRKEVNPTYQFDDQVPTKITQQMIDSAIANRDRTYMELYKKDSTRAEIMYAKATEYINRLINLKEEQEKSA